MLIRPGARVGIGLQAAALDRAGLVRAHDAWAERVQREVATRPHGAVARVLWICERDAACPISTG